jgi:hypothetical protein
MFIAKIMKIAEALEQGPGGKVVPHTARYIVG